MFCNNASTNTLFISTFKFPIPYTNNTNLYLYSINSMSVFPCSVNNYRVCSIKVYTVTYMFYPENNYLDHHKMNQCFTSLFYIIIIY